MLVPLLLADGKSVSRLELAEWMGPGRTPQDVDRHLAAFRRTLTAMGFRHALASRGESCRLVLAPDRVDLYRLRAAVADAERLDDRTAAERLRAALDLCAGEPLAGLTGSRAAACRHALREDRRTAEVALVRVECRLGRLGHHVPDLVRLSRERLADTEVVGLTMHALHVTGKPDEAVALYQRYREHLVELGVSVPKPMQDLRIRISRVDSH